MLSAALKSAIDHSKNNPAPRNDEQLWREAQFAQLERKARAGDVDAQFHLGTFFIQAQQAQAQQWICAAANHGHAGAQLQYGHWFNEDRKHEDLFPFIRITPNNSEAFFWYSLAVQNGESRAGLFRDSLVYGGLHAVETDQARARLASWSAQDCGDTQQSTPTVIVDSTEQLAAAR